MTENATGWESEDGDLLRAVAENGNREAYRRLFDRYYARVFVFTERRLGDRELAREVTSDVFLEVWSSAAGFRGESKISSWIFGIARFKCLEAIRGRSRLKRSRVVATDDEIIARAPDGQAPGARVDARHELRRVAEVMERLPSEQREALELVVLKGFSTEEAASQQNVSRDTVKTRVSRARRSLRRMLGVAEGATR